MIPCFGLFYFFNIKQIWYTYSPISQEHKIYFFILLFASSGNSNEYNSCYFEWSSLIKPCSITSFNQLKEATKFLLGVPPPILFFSLTPESESAKVSKQKPTRWSLLRVQQLNYHDDTDQGLFLVVSRDFIVLYKNPKQGDRRITQVIKPIRSS